MTNLILSKSVKRHPKQREAFFSLAKETFGLSFAEWYAQGFWTDAYIPYTLFDGDRAAANISVNQMHTRYCGQSRSYLQIGTVMTAPEYQGQGLSRHLMETVFADWYEKCDAIYLFANDTVLDFYPRFGFIQALEHQFSLPISPISGKIQKLNMDKETDRLLLRRHYQMSNPFSRLPMLDNYGLLMFYCTSFMRSNIYYLEDFDAIVIGEKNGTCFICYDIYCRPNVNFQAVLAAAAPAGTTQIQFGFAPIDTAGMTSQILTGEDTLFVLKDKENPMANHPLMFPFLSHA